MVFGALVLAACLLAGQILRSPPETWSADRGLRARLGLDDRRVVALGLVLGLAALTRNEAIWLAIAWAIVAWRVGGLTRRRRVALIVGAAIPAIVVFLPWAVRDWLAFGSPFPGQALANALSLEGRDIFAWRETPTLARYLDAGIGTLVGLRIAGFFHNLVNVLLLLGIPISAIGLGALPWTATGRPFEWRLPALGLPSRSAEPAAPAVIVRAEAPRPMGTSLAGPTGGQIAGPAGDPFAPSSATGLAAPQPRPPSVTQWPAVDLPGAHQADRPPAWMQRPARLEPIVPVRAAPGALSMLLVFSGLTFIATTLLFPVATTWGTFLHAAAAVQVLLLLSALIALDRLIAEVGRRRAWTRPVAWLGPFLGVAASALFTLVLLPGFGRDGEGTRERFEALAPALAAAGVPLEVGGAPVITDFPIYLAEITGANALALPDEPPESVLDLAAAFPGTRLVIVAEDNEGIWPEAALSTSQGIACFDLVPVELEGLRVYQIICP
jgi:hypothetical protein